MFRDISKFLVYTVDNVRRPCIVLGTARGTDKGDEMGITTSAAKFDRQDATALETESRTIGWIFTSKVDGLICMTLPFLFDTPLSVDSRGWDSEDRAIRAARGAWDVFGS